MRILLGFSFARFSCTDGLLGLGSSISSSEMLIDSDALARAPSAVDCPGCNRDLFALLGRANDCRRPLDVEGPGGGEGEERGDRYSFATCTVVVGSCLATVNV